MTFIPTPSLSKKGQKSEDKRVAKEHTRGIDDNSSRLQALEKNVSRQSLMLEAFWALLKQETSLDDNALLKKLAETQTLIEARKNEKARCSACRRDVPANKRTCHYCGKSLELKEKTEPFPL